MFGSNQYGELGDNSIINKFTPVNITSNIITKIDNQNTG